MPCSTLPSRTTRLPQRLPLRNPGPRHTNNVHTRWRRGGFDAECDSALVLLPVSWAATSTASTYRIADVRCCDDQAERAGCGGSYADSRQSLRDHRHYVRGCLQVCV